MSGLDPVAAFAAAALANAQAAVQEAALNLGALIEDFRAQISVGEILTATVLPAENGVDRIGVLGQTLPAQLPPGINPGEHLALQVTGFTNTAILVRNLGVVDPSQPLPQAPELPQPAPGAAQSAVLSVKAPIPQPPAQPNPVQQTPAQQTPAQQTPVAPPRELFVAASVQPPPATKSAPAPTPPADLETRIAASRAAPLPPPDASIATSKTGQVPKAPTQAQTAAQAQTPPAAAKQSPIAPPLNELLAKTLTAPILVRNAVPRADVERTADVLPGKTAPGDATSQTHANATIEGALLTRLRVPLSGTTLAAARVIETATQSVTSAYQKLDALLAKLVPDERVSSMRALLSFVGRIDLRNARAMPEQIAAYVSNVVTGAESKIAQIVRAWSQGVAMEQLPNETAGPSTANMHDPSTATRQQLPANAAPTELADLSTANVARVAERAVALQHDLKTALLQLVANPPAGASAQVVQALREALTATTAVQLNALNLQQNNPNAITIALPAYFHQDGRPAQLRIDKDAPDSKNRIDADNFHIAFVLDTASLGTVAIDVQTVGREVRVDVKTEVARSADRFRSTLPQLGSRLEALHYRVASMAAAVANRPSQVASATQGVASEKSSSNVDAKA